MSLDLGKMLKVTTWKKGFSHLRNGNKLERGDKVSESDTQLSE